MTPKAYLAAHGTTRWHTNHQVPSQTIADHSAGVAKFILWLDPRASYVLLYEALHHDDGEGGVGDMPGPAKRKYPYAADRVRLAENIERAEMKVHELALTGTEKELLRICDELDAFTWAATMAPPWVVMADDWQEMKRKLITRSYKLSEEIGDKVSGWLKEISV